MGIPFRKQIKKVRTKYKNRKHRPSPNPDGDRIKRELDYMRRLGSHNPRLNKLRDRIASRRRRSYGR